ncbi:hypothetical protein KP509_18G059200 [Ceratopteris richardii]|uniref:Uncharacterized protein n=1 Tax=Ceratopteris richardii TaxID=49495 RepID=A0A8T2ST93_CERRI|nr:hypothetical protein KP509_18G059200 [Ceratopteris richardii]
MEFQPSFILFTWIMNVTACDGPPLNLDLPKRGIQALSKATRKPIRLFGATYYILYF